MTTKITPNTIFMAAWKAFIIENRPPCLRLEYATPRQYTPAGQPIPSPHVAAGCVLREGDSRCAVGLCLTDEQINQCGQRDGAAAIYQSHPDWIDTSVPQDTYVNLQLELHDQLAKRGYGDINDKPEWLYPIEERRKRYIEIAHKYNLKFEDEDIELKVLMGEVLAPPMHKAHRLGQACCRMLGYGDVDSSMMYILLMQALGLKHNISADSEGLMVISMTDRLMHIINTDPFFQMPTTNNPDLDNFVNMTKTPDEIVAEKAPFFK